MTAEEVIAEVRSIRRLEDQAKAAHKRDMAILRSQFDFVRAHCEHKWVTRSIMGRDTVTECDYCDKER